MTCPTCHSYEPLHRYLPPGGENIIECCTEPAHAGFAAGANETYRAAFRAKREAELAAARRAPKTKAIADLYWELSDAEYDEALEAVGLER